ncbi:unnamed protein product [Acanthoscelides obtectus]|uniref:cGMP-dependent protein kinase n=1 Tax=Acanthoscelides obtectus TaxID=200917 RepID=A0A9P0LJK8_ACAOB|nr:unnamed protein product [Acanthoscelides obtectus]CAK1673273.1 cGMP-dependent protein kinase, isozyme 1 [Acanthoscelides obtectus]
MGNCPTCSYSGGYSISNGKIISTIGDGHVPIQDKSNSNGNPVKVVYFDSMTSMAGKKNDVADDAEIKPDQDTTETDSDVQLRKNSKTSEERRPAVFSEIVKFDENDDITLPSYPKSPEDEQLIRDAIGRNDFLSKIISGTRLDDVVPAFYMKEVSAKETVIKQGNEGYHMYISISGKYQIIVNGKITEQFDDVRVFGELAILYNAKRMATIKAITEGKVWVLDSNVYQKITQKHNIKEADEIMQFLLNNKTLNVIGKDALQIMSTSLKTEKFLPGAVIVKQGDKGNKFYIIRAGTVTITKDGEGVVGVYKKGDCFGEIALLKEDCRKATVTADQPMVECLTLARKEFIDIFGEMGEIFQYVYVDKPKSSITEARVEYEDVDLNDDLDLVGTLGVGGFGRVELVRHKQRAELQFALKYIKKVDIVRMAQQEHVFNEKNLQMKCRSQFIVRLYRTYKDKKYIYFLMEACLGGELFNVLHKQKNKRFDEDSAKFICACVLEAFDYLHSRGIMYRDLKPENLVFARNGYIKLTDFSFAKEIVDRHKTYTFAGTPEYVAPEIVLNKGHDRAVDYWEYGIFVFEMLTGKTPFRSNDPNNYKTYTKILSGIESVQFPTYMGIRPRNLIEKLCKTVPSERLGMQRGGVKDIKNHKWFSGWDWQTFKNCEIPSPFRSALINSNGITNFPKYPKDYDIPEDETSGWDEHF